MAAGDKTYWSDIDLLLNPPSFRAVQQAAQSMVNATDGAITFGAGSEEYDSHNYHSESVNTSRYTPLISGQYLVIGTFYVVATAALTVIAATIAVNGSVQAPRVRQKPAGLSTAASIQVVTHVEVDGIDDYIELIGQQTSGASLNTSIGGTFASSLEIVRVRSLP